MTRPRTAGVAGRLLALALLVPALLDPSLPLGRRPLQLILLWDESESMDRATSDDAWRRLLELTPGLPAGSRLTLLRFAGESHLELDGTALGELPGTLPRSRALDGSGTDLEQALSAARVLASPGADARLLLFSDGLENRGRVSRALPTPGDPPAYWWRPRARAAESPWIRSVHVPEDGRRPLPLTLTLAGTAGPDTRIEVSVDGLAAASLALPPGPLDGLPLRLDLPMPDPGRHRIDLDLATAGLAIQRRTELVRIPGPARVLVLGGEAPDSPVTRALAAGGWPVQAQSPNHAGAALLEGADLVVLDDLAVSDLPGSFWEALAAKVRREGLGLLVLGGERSFGAGGYRHSLLEGLLPVTAEAPRPVPPASVLFLVDKSGSMGQAPDPDQPSRLALARRAVLETAGGLAPGDRVGLLAFDVAPLAALPLAAHGAPAEALERAWTFPPGGGTRLAPALAQSLDWLAGTPAGLRLLVLVTDGFTEEAPELERLAGEAHREGVRLIALAIGPEAQVERLERLAGAGGGRALPVAEVAHLPRLMRQEVDRERSPLEPGPVTPRAAGPVPFFDTPPGQWPPVAGYLVTKARPQARIYLDAPNGDPLLAGWTAGAGRVLALTAGLGPLARGWADWEGWGSLVGGLAEWTAGAGDQGLALRRQSSPQGIRLLLETLDPDGDWSAADGIEAAAFDADGLPVAVTVEAQAPGRFQIRVDAHREGAHPVHLRLGERSVGGSYYFQPLAELSPDTQAAQGLEGAVREGTVRVWQPDQGLPAQPRTVSLRPLLAGTALLVFLTTLAAERGFPLPPGLRRRIASHFPTSNRRIS